MLPLRVAAAGQVLGSERSAGALGSITGGQGRAGRDGRITADPNDVLVGIGKSG